MTCSDHESNNAVVFIEAQGLSAYIPAVPTTGGYARLIHLPVHVR